MTTRRGFLRLCGVAGAGTVVAKLGVPALPRRMAPQLAGRCSFCGKGRAELFGLVGVANGRDRICDECTGLGLVVFANEPSERCHPSVRQAQCSFCGRPRAEVRWLMSGPRVFICDGCVGEAGGLMGLLRPMDDLRNTRPV